MSGLGISILSTPKGVMSGASAKRQKLGGEILANIW
jgi:small subunit ribosomal protein S8